MPYVGGKIASLFKPEPTRVALREMADEGGEKLHDLIIMNTPIGGRFEGSRRGGNLRTSWYRTVVNRTNLGGIIRYETTVATDVEYAPDVEWGTGLWGPKHAKYLIQPKPGKNFLRWIDPRTGKPVFARRVWHPGSPGQHMVAIACTLLEHEIEMGLFTGILERWARAQEAGAD